MPALLLYLLQVNVGLVLFYLTYQLVLRQITFYSLNRLFLLTGLVLSSLYPLVDVLSLFEEKKQIYQTFQTFSPNWVIHQMPTPEASGFDFWLIPVGVFWLGVGVMTLRFLGQLASLYTIHQKSKNASYRGFKYRKIQASLPPFSFGKTIYFNSGQHPERDWLPILQHEHTHVREWHTLDILLVEITTLFHWFNPAVWLLRKSLKQNLEFLTDQQTLKAGLDRKQYQFSLLQTTEASSLSFTSSFSYPSLKHRIMMMNKAPSSRAQHLRFVVALPLLAFSLVSLQGIATANSTPLWETSPQDGPAKKTISPQDDYDVFLRRNPSIDKVGWNQNTIYIHLKSGKTETYPRTAEGTAAAEKKYGTLPPPPPPPPAPPAAPDAALAPPPPPPPLNVELNSDFKKRNPTIKGLSVGDESLYVIFKSGEVESFDTTPTGLAAFEKKYGKLPPPPPPQRKSAPKTKTDN
ncbi:M56 family metallopeptidase [Rufibacter tibetensis]|uniref:Peptidase M56 domain-containing protein n=1 Tax=Rufibacter tibetensis TaxID=512763 RepID=A0A0P0CPH6_9BACT|nr:M56 family metallopeptidase [Rufibacter tibetensis]ALI98213.1 hypothetical protein DC20_03480 [Rufibacter tibetensis]